MNSKIEQAKSKISGLKEGKRTPRYKVLLAKFQTTLADYKKIKIIWNCLCQIYFGKSSMGSA